MTMAGFASACLGPHAYPQKDYVIIKQQSLHLADVVNSSAYVDFFHCLLGPSGFYIKKEYIY